MLTEVICPFETACAACHYSWKSATASVLTVSFTLFEDTNYSVDAAAAAVLVM